MFNNLTMLHDTLQILRQGSYQLQDGRTVPLKLRPEEMEAAQVLLPEEVRNISLQVKPPYVMGRCRYNCLNTDSFAAARQQCRSYASTPKEKPVLVLNFANSMRPGGGVRQGAAAQEEDLCRKSSLLLSLESKEAARYYSYHRRRMNIMASDAILLSPQVEIIRDEHGALLEDTVVVAVLTCAAPMLTFGKGLMREKAYQEMVYNRIMGMLTFAACSGYKNLVLGAWGCGAFGNDARVISDLFYKALKELNIDGMREKDFFRQIDFAVLDRSKKQYNFNEFNRNFAAFYREEDRTQTDAVQARRREAEPYLDKIRGCLFGGAAGDALGYPVEFLEEQDIFARYGDKGIQSYALYNGKARISDDTQMTLFTANGLLVADTRQAMRGIGAAPHAYLAMAYQDWLRTQEQPFSQGRGDGQDCISWLMDVPELYSCRAPGNTCLASLRQHRQQQSRPESYIQTAQNNSKGCGGIMRAAPLALKAYPHVTNEDIDREGAELAAITHGHSLGYMPAAVLVHIIRGLVYPQKEQALRALVLEARDAIAALFAGDQHLQELTDIIDLAVRLSENSGSDLDNIHRLGEGWVAEETLAIAIYCALRYQNDFSAGITAAVNHSGDSDSTGAVAGNILGALLGYDAIEEKWKRDLELSDIILELADDLCYGCQMSEYSTYQDPAWVRKYMECRRPEKN